MSTGPTKATRMLVCHRCGLSCELCSRPAHSGQIHHRKPRAMGGSRGDPTINAPSNLVLLCADCHRFIETCDRRGAYHYGWLVPHGRAPADTPYLLYGQWVFLTDDGRYLPYNAEGTTHDGNDG